VADERPSSTDGLEPIRPDHPDEVGFEIANEFARVWVRKRYTRNGVRLEITAPRLDSGILLDAMLLESLTWQSDETLASFLSTPFQVRSPEPVDDPEDRSR
jgi:hypothetical protein